MSDSSNSEDSLLNYSETSFSRKRKDQENAEEQKSTQCWTPSGFEEPKNAPSSPKTSSIWVLETPGEEEPESTFEFLAVPKNDSVVQNFLEDIQIKVLSPESQNYLYVRYFYIIEVKRKSAQYRIRRSYSMFEWLYFSLVNKNKGQLIPGIPSKNIRSNLPLADAKMLEERRSKFSRFLKDCLARFKTWTNPDDLYYFLKFEETTGSFFLNYMETHPFKSSQKQSSLVQKIGKTVYEGFYRTKEALWDKFE